MSELRRTSEISLVYNYNYIVLIFLSKKGTQLADIWEHLPMAVYLEMADCNVSDISSMNCTQQKYNVHFLDLSFNDIQQFDQVSVNSKLSRVRITFKNVRKYSLHCLRLYISCLIDIS